MFLKIKVFFRVFSTCLLAFSLFSVFALEAHAKKGHKKHYHQEKRMHKKSHGGPPSHAPAHGYRKKKIKYDYYSHARGSYYYFPETKVYVWQIKQGDQYVVKFGKNLPAALAGLLLKPVRSSVWDAPVVDNKVNFSLLKIDLF